jgi:tetratricopeptide (TPR) repeat protein
MPKLPIIVASISALLAFAASPPASAQSQSNSSQSIPDAPQPQKKPAAKPQSTDSGSQPSDKTNAEPPASDKPAPKPSSAKDDNPFPEDVSKQAAKPAAGSSDSDHPADPQAAAPKAAAPKHSTGADNPFPEDVSKQAAKTAAGSSDSDHPADPQATAPKRSTAADNPFPESQSRDAAKAAGNDPAPAAKPDVPPGFSSSQSTPGPDQVADPVRAKKDAEVGGFYLQSGDYQGALLRYKDAAAADPTNVDAIFGLAESQRLLKKNADAARNYQLYLDIVPNGPKSKQALKALKALGSGG